MRRIARQARTGPTKGIAGLCTPEAEDRRRIARASTGSPDGTSEGKDATRCTTPASRAHQPSDPNETGGRDHLPATNAEGQRPQRLLGTANWKVAPTRLEPHRQKTKAGTLRRRLGQAPGRGPARFLGESGKDPLRFLVPGDPVKKNEEREAPRASGEACYAPG